MGDSAEISGIKGFNSFPFRLGDAMRGERATLGKSLLDVQRDLRIRATYIAAIENCDSSAFTTPGFIAGYVRSYARYLNLDPEATFAQFCDEAGFDGVHPNIGLKPRAKKSAQVVQVRSKASDPLIMPHAPDEALGNGFLGQVSASALGSVLVLLVLIAGIGYGAWSVLQDIQRVEIVPDESVKIKATAKMKPPSMTATARLNQLYAPRELDVPVMTPRDGPIVALDPNKIGALINNNAGRIAQETAHQLASGTPRVTENVAPKVAIVARRPAWVRVSMPDGKVLFEKILDRSESFELPVNIGAMVLRAGNSGAVYLTLNGVAYGPVGSGASVVKNVALMPMDIAKTYSKVSDTAALNEIDSPRVITLNEQP